jgi:hypothetical protein
VASTLGDEAARVLEVWPRLPEPLKAAILAMVNASGVAKP